MSGEAMDGLQGIEMEMLREAMLMFRRARASHTDRELAVLATGAVLRPFMPTFFADDNTGELAVAMLSGTYTPAAMLDAMTPTFPDLTHVANIARAHAVTWAEIDITVPA